METISNIANTVTTTAQAVVNTASKVVFGEQPKEENATGGEEPLSGVTGKGTAEEPYDAGNATGTLTLGQLPRPKSLWNGTGDLELPSTAFPFLSPENLSS